MIVALLLALQAGAQQPRPRPPQRPLPDPGVIAVEQRVTPAGVQSVFGVDSMALVAFGVKPRLPTKRRRLTLDEKIVKREAEIEALKAAKAAAEKKKG